MIDLEPAAFGTHSLRRTKVALVYKKTGNLRACQLLLGHRKLESTVRYLGIEVGENSHRPYPVETILSRRFGDCKDKSLLLCTMLRRLGFEAHPSLVDTDVRHNLAEWLPSPLAFDHMVTQLRFHGKDIWLDPTDSDQGGPLAVHGHRNGWGMLNRHPLLGVEFPAYQKLWRLAGVDQIHVNGIANKFWESDDSVVQSIHACLTPFGRGETILPVVSSGQWGGQAEETLRRTQTLDVMYLAGGGILAHPGGVAAGVTAIRQAWDAASAGISLEDHAHDHVELRQAADLFPIIALRQNAAGTIED